VSGKSSCCEKQTSPSHQEKNSTLTQAMSPSAKIERKEQFFGLEKPIGSFEAKELNILLPLALKRA
jgi:hypothetical protein